MGASRLHGYRRIVLLLLITGLFQAATASSSPSTRTTWKRSRGRKLQIINESEKIVALYWWNPDNKQEVPLSSGPHHLLPSARYPSETFVGHVFIAREQTSSCTSASATDATSDKTGRETSIQTDTEEGVCRQAWITVSENDDQVATIQPDFSIDFVDNVVRARRQAQALVSDCQLLNETSTQEIVSYNYTDRLASWLSCIESSLAESLEVAHEEIAEQSTIRQELGSRSEDYICADPTAESSPDIAPVERWTDKYQYSGGESQRTASLQSTTRMVHIKHDRPASKIHVVENFISQEECLAVQQAAAPLLEAATVADGKGGQELGGGRKALQAGIAVSWENEMNGNLIAQVSRRVYNYANHVLGLEIDEHGQEDLMSIQYFGRGRDDDAPDRYMPHCDDFCDGLRHQPAARVATMVMYCSTAQVGGHTNFMNAGVHVKPDVGDGIFFSYIDPVTMVKDTGLTIHSGCPVYEGHKHIVTQWIRLGVDEENTWEDFDSNNLKISDMEDIFGDGYYYKGEVYGEEDGEEGEEDDLEDEYDDDDGMDDDENYMNDDIFI